MGGIKSKIFSDLSLDNSDMDKNHMSLQYKQSLSTSSFKKSKILRHQPTSSEKLNLNDFEYYYIDEDSQKPQSANLDQVENDIEKYEQINDKNIKNRPKNIEISTFTDKLNSNVTTPNSNLTEHEYNNIQHKKLRDHSLFDSAQTETNKSIN